MALPGISAELYASGPTPVGSLWESGASPPDEFANDEHWTGGIRWAPGACKNGGVDDFCSSEAYSLGTSPTGDAVTQSFVTPLVLEAAYRASALGNAGIENCAEQRAIDALVRNQSRLLELEFWDGAKARSKNLNNQFLSNNADDQGSGGALPTKATDIASAGYLGAGTTFKVKKAFGALEYFTMDRLGGSRCMIHVPAFVVPYLTANQIIDVQGKLLLTKLGNIVVAGVGYTGSAPGTADAGSPTIDATQDTTWIYGTDVVTVWKEKQIVVTQTTLAQAMDPTLNKVEYRATRFAATSMNRCVNLAVKLDLANS